MEVLERGQERFNVYCTPCHSRVGNGLGEIVQRGYKPAANLNDQVRRSQPISHYFYVMTHGYGAMPDYSEQLTPEDRWAVAAYIRALQLSQAATSADVPSGAQVRDLKDLAAEAGHPDYAQPWSLPAPQYRHIRRQTKARRRWLPRNPADPTDQDSSKQNGSRGREVRIEFNGSRNTRCITRKALPADLGAPPLVDGWRSRALIVGAIAAVVAVVLAFPRSVSGSSAGITAARLGAGYDCSLSAGPWADSPF